MSIRFIDGNTITDSKTGLMWTKEANLRNARMSWQNALNFVAKLNADKHLGSTNWQIPTIEEMESLVDRSQHNPALPAGHPFINVVNKYYWSSTTFAGDTDNAWIVSMGSGHVMASYKSSPFYVWIVRNPLNK